jgi:hypothetical protein
MKMVVDDEEMTGGIGIEPGALAEARALAHAAPGPGEEEASEIGTGE